MDEGEISRRLSSISTVWTVVAAAHQGPPDEASVARKALVERYLRAIYRYLLGAVRDAEVADELCQEFCLRFVRGDFRNADPQRGRFRDLLRTALINLVINYQKRKKPLPLAAESQLEAPPPGDPEADFVARWREELLRRAWEALEAYQQESGRPLYTVLHCRADQPRLSSEELAEQLSERLGKPLTAVAFRQVLHRARVKFAALLEEEVRQSLPPGAPPERIEEELVELGLFQYCRSARRLGE
jgi:RNA polymerase sigma-70 factor (ECF subfamily)